MELDLILMFNLIFEYSLLGVAAALSTRGGHPSPGGMAASHGENRRHCLQSGRQGSAISPHTNHDSAHKTTNNDPVDANNLLFPAI